jgi:hypothetical protein
VPFTPLEPPLAHPNVVFLVSPPPPPSRHRRAAGAFEAACANMATAKRAAEEALLTYSEAETKRQRAAE